jgi:hypothetical protein
MDLKLLVDLGWGYAAGGEACSVQHCPRLERYDRLIRDGIGALEKTKGAFKSRTLEELRIRMEQALGDGAWPAQQKD